MARRSRLCAVLAVLTLAGCTSSPNPTPGRPSSAPAGPVAGRPALQLVAYESCTELTAKLRAAARKNVDSFGLKGQFESVPNAASRTADLAAPAGAPPAYSGTNVHEKGVDEPDIVKTDGRRIVTIAADALHVIDPATRRTTGKLALSPGQGGQAQLLLSGDRALVLVSGNAYGGMTRMARPLSHRSEVLLVDLSGAQPRLLSRYQGDGRLVDARQNGSVARVVLSSGPKIGFPHRAGNPEAMLDENRDAIDAAPANAWLPAWDITTDGRTTSGRLGCGAVNLPEKYSGTAMLRVLSFDLNAAALDDGAPVALVADGDTVYGTPDALYIANNQHWQIDSVAEPGTRVRPATDTDIYRFDLPATGKPVYTASGKVAGTLLNQYAMSEWDGHLRVATTKDSNVSAVRVLRVSDGKFTEVGIVDGLGRGERIYSVRFLGPRAYVVTFRQTDPLYSLDLSVPARPKLTGELKITGYSAHLQQVGDNRLVGIGQEVRLDQFSTRAGAQVSLFDVADPAKPRRLDQHLVKDGWSEAENDPHAVLWWPATGLLVLPVADAKSNGALALKVTADGLGEATRLAPDAVSPVRRSLVVGDVLWSVTEEGLLASNLSTLDRIGWVSLG